MDGTKRAGEAAHVCAAGKFGHYPDAAFSLMLYSITEKLGSNYCRRSSAEGRISCLPRVCNLWTAAELDVAGKSIPLCKGCVPWSLLLTISSRQSFLSVCSPVHLGLCMSFWSMHHEGHPLQCRN